MPAIWVPYTETSHPSQSEAICAEPAWPLDLGRPSTPCFSPRPGTPVEVFTPRILGGRITPPILLEAPEAVLITPRPTGLITPPLLLEFTGVESLSQLAVTPRDMQDDVDRGASPLGLATLDGDATGAQSYSEVQGRVVEHGMLEITWFDLVLGRFNKRNCVRSQQRDFRCTWLDRVVGGSREGRPASTSSAENTSASSTSSSSSAPAGSAAPNRPRSLQVGLSSHQLVTGLGLVDPSWFDAEVPWSRMPFAVRRAFRMKCYGLAALQMMFISAGTAALDPFLNAEDHGMLGAAILVGSIVTSMFSLWGLWCLRRKHPWNLAFNVLTMLQATIFWTMIDFTMFVDHGDLAFQTVFILFVTVLVNVFLVQLEVPVAQEGYLICCGAVAGWAVALVFNCLITVYARDVSMDAVVMPGLASFLTVLALVLICFDKLLYCNPDDFVYVSFVLQCLQFLAVTVPILWFVFALGGTSASGYTGNGDGPHGNITQESEQQNALPAQLQPHDIENPTPATVD